MVMKYKWILLGVSVILAIVLCWVFGVFTQYDRIELTVRVDSPQEIKLIISSDENLKIDWGDGIVENDRHMVKHTYKNSGTYNIVVCGKDISSFKANNVRMEILNFVHCPNLKTLSCQDNYLKELDLSTCPLLEDIDCSDNQLGELDVSYCSGLKQLYCNNNKLVSLDVSEHKNLNDLSCYQNHLETLNVDKCQWLNELSCFDNKLAYLDVKSCFRLKKLWCSNNHLIVLEVPFSLMELKCSANRLKELKIESMSLLKLECNNNQLKRLDLQCTSLLYINCYNNQLPVLNLLDCPFVLGASYDPWVQILRN